MGPKAAAEFLRSFSVEEQLAELQAMLKAGGRVTNLAHGIAVELKVAEHDEIKEQMVSTRRWAPSIKSKMKPKKTSPKGTI